MSRVDTWKMATTSDIMSTLHSLKQMQYSSIENKGYIAPTKRKVFIKYTAGEWKRRWRYTIYYNDKTVEITDIDITSISPKRIIIRLFNNKRWIKDMCVATSRYSSSYKLMHLKYLYSRPHVKNVARLLLFLDKDCGMPSEMQEIVLQLFIKVSNIVQ